jgi:hypothetical protein
MFGQEDGEIHSLMTVLDKQNAQSDDALAALFLSRQAQFCTVNTVVCDEVAAGVSRFLLSPCVMTVLKKAGGHSPAKEQGKPTSASALFIYS